MYFLKDINKSEIWVGLRFPFYDKQIILKMMKILSDLQTGTLFPQKCPQFIQSPQCPQYPQSNKYIEFNKSYSLIISAET